MKINIITLGCSKNTVDSENVAGHLTRQGHRLFFDRADNDCDVVVVNTCGFIGDAKEESVQTLLEQVEAKRRFDRRHRHDGRRRRLIATGCLIQRYRDALQAELPEVDGWYGVNEWEQAIAAAGNTAPSLPFCQQRILSTPSHYAYLKIAEGCNRSCSYCAIPLIRGPYVSRPIDELVDEARQMVSDGVRELLVIAQDTTYYGLDRYGYRRIGELLDRLASESGARWIRLHYTYPADFPDDVIAAIRNHDNICNYIDIPLQHINSGLLHSMRRGIDRDETLRLIDRLRSALPDICLRTTLIVGYPGEGEQEFDELKTFVTNARFDRMGCFAYSQEEGTPAEPLGDPVPDEEKQRRVSELMAIQESISRQRNEQLVGKTLTVLIDRAEGDYFVGRTEYDSPEIDDEVLIPVSQYRCTPGHFYQASVTGAMENDLFAKVTAPAPI